MKSMQSIKKKQAKSGYWYRSTKFETCCDCGLTHYREWKVRVGEERLNKLLDKAQAGGSIKLYMRNYREEKMTAKNRKNRKVKLV